MWRGEHQQSNKNGGRLGFPSVGQVRSLEVPTSGCKNVGTFWLPAMMPGLRMYLGLSTAVTRSVKTERRVSVRLDQAAQQRHGLEATGNATNKKKMALMSFWQHDSCSKNAS